LQRETHGASGDASLRIHRLTQEILLNHLSRDLDARALAFRRVVSMLSEFHPPRSKLMRPSETSTALAFAVLPHIMHAKDIFTTADPPMTGTVEFAQLLVLVGNMDLYDRGRIHEALSIIDVAEQIFDSLDVPELNEYRGDILIIRGLCYDGLGIAKRFEGMQVRQKCRKIREACFAAIPPEERERDDEILLFNSHMDYVCSLQHFNRFDEAESIIGTCLQQYKRWGPESGPGFEEKLAYEYAKYYNQMAYIHLYRGSDAEAVSFSRKGYEFMSRNDPNTQASLSWKFDWASILFQTGHVDQALVEHLAILKSREDLCGKDNLWTMQSNLNLGIIYFHSGKLDMAR
jgi:tetratricopeptide (TPR) repeat protein